MLLKNLIFAVVLLIGTAYLVYEVFPGSRGFPAATPAPDVESISQVASNIDREFHDHWNAKNLQTAGKASNLIIARRLSLALTGTIPSLEEIRQFEQVPVENQIDWWAGYLLKDPRYSDYVAERLARAYVGTENGPFIVYRRRRFVMWLSEQLSENRPYDELVRELIGNNGLWTDTPSVNFYTVTIDNQKSQPDPIRLAARTTRAFLGLRIDCLQCHDDALGTMELGEPEAPREGKQQDFHRLAAAFVSVRQTAAGLQDTPEPLDYRFKFLNADSERIVPFDVPFRNDLLPTEGTDRERLGKWITHPENDSFGRALVNRVWAIMAGRALYDPVDNIPLFGNRPPGLDTLAQDFVTNGYDLHRLIRIIAQTEAFQKSSTASFDVTDRHENNWSVFPQNPLRPEQVVGSLIQATSLKTINDRSNVFQKLFTFGDINDFIRRYGDPGEDEFRTRTETIQQKNIMMNGKVVAERTRANGLIVNASSQISRFCETNELAVETLFLVVLSRRPTSAESEFLVKQLQTAQSSNPEKSVELRTKIIEDILWTLFNKLEFLRNH